MERRLLASAAIALSVFCLWNIMAFKLELSAVLHAAGVIPSVSAGYLNLIITCKVFKNENM